MKIVKFFSVSLVILGLAFCVQANEEIDLTVFKKLHKPIMPELKKPTVVSMKLLRDEEFGVAIIEERNDLPQPWIKIPKFEEQNKTTVGNVSEVIGNPSALADGNFDTSAEFNLDADMGNAFVEIEGEKEIVSNSLKLFLDNHVALPQRIAVFALVGDEWKTVVAERGLFSNVVVFPETRATKWRVTFRHSQPLRVREIEISDIQKESMRGVEIRWLARPDKTYTVYSDAQAYVKIRTSERGALQGDELQVVPVKPGKEEMNPIFQEPDDDDDGVPNLVDNCVNVENTGQEDIDDNGRGDACEDDDGDTVLNFEDNCPAHPNRGQTDDDNDGKGNVCDKEEDRITEKNPWLPWAAMSLAALVVVGVAVQTIRREKKGEKIEK